MTEHSELVVSDTFSVRDEGKREIEVRLAPWDTVTETNQGLEVIERGAFADVDPDDVVMRIDHENPAGGRGISLEERDDGPYMVLRADRSPRGEQILQGAIDRTYRYVSVGFDWLGYRKVMRDGKRVTAHSKVGLREVSLSWRPAYKSAAIMAVRSEVKEMDEATQPTPDETPAAPLPAVVDTKTEERHLKLVTELQERLDKLEESGRKTVTLPELLRGKTTFTQERSVVMDSLAIRELAEVVTADNLGVVPDATASEMIGIIDSTRPFLASTRQLPTPAAGMNLIVPKITQRPLVAQQVAEKDEVASRKTIITAVDFPFLTYAGAADLSIQLIKRSSPEFLSLWLELLGEAYAVTTENAAVDALLAETAVVEGTATFDPLTGDISFGEAFTNTQAISPRLFPDTIWLSTPAVAAMIDAKTDGTNTPLFGNLALNADASGGVSGNVSGLRAVHVPALDDEAVDAIVGPRRGFAWAEDGTYTLQADIPSKAGRDVGIVGMIAFATWYPAAFTTYALAS